MNNTAHAVTAAEIIDNAENSIVLYNFFKARLIGCGGQCYSRIYLDLDENRLFESTEASSNTWLHRDDGSLAEITADAGWGADLTDEELAWLEEDGVSEFGYQDWLDDVVEPAIQAALDYWHNGVTE